jgi:hypothetical protein
MRIKKLTDSSVLKPGELLVVLHCLNQCGSDAREQRMSGGLTSATRRQKKSSNLMASPSSSGKNENGICCPTPIMIFPSGIKEAGKSIVEHSERARAASTVESTALPSGFGEARRGLTREINYLQDIFLQRDGPKSDRRS